MSVFKEADFAAAYYFFRSFSKRGKGSNVFKVWIGEGMAIILGSVQVEQDGNAVIDTDAIGIAQEYRV